MYELTNIYILESSILLLKLFPGIDTEYRNYSIDNFYYIFILCTLAYKKLLKYLNLIKQGS
jgi:hypothetical protein